MIIKIKIKIKIKIEKQRKISVFKNYLFSLFNLSIITFLALISKVSSKGDNEISSYLLLRANVKILSASSGFLDKSDPWKYVQKVFL